MVGRETRFEDTCEIMGIKNEIFVIGEILTFRGKQIIIATIERSARQPSQARSTAAESLNGGLE